MKHTLVKLMGLTLALMLVLTGCNLIAIDPMMQLDEDFAKLDKNYAAVVAEYEGGKLTKGDVLGSFASSYSYYSQMYSMFGMSMNDSVIEDIKQQSLEHAVQGVAMKRELEKRGLTLTEEQLQEVQTTADSNYKQAYDSFYAQAAGKGDVKARQTEYDMYVNGYSKDFFYKSQLHEAEEALIEETVKGEIAELTDEELQAAYDAKVAEDEGSYSGNAGAFESAMSSEDGIVAWRPEGYRTVKHILVKPADDVLAAVTDARTALTDAQTKLEDLESELDAQNDADPAEETTEVPASEDEATTALQADIDAARADVDAAKAAVADAEAACLDSVKEKTDAIYAKLAEGADFADLIAEYGEDPGMKNEPTATRGYYVSADSATWDKNFTAGAMALANVGDVSDTPVISTSGVHIIRYESEVAPGAVPLDEIRDALYETTLTTRKDDHYSESLESWVAALNPVYHIDAFTLG
ncbi:MAG: peptidylprolyl isomerase [bacterium]